MVKKKKKKKKEEEEKRGQKCNFWKEKGQRTVAYDERCVRDMRLELFSWCSWKSFSGICFGSDRLGFALLKLNPRRGFFPCNRTNPSLPFNPMANYFDTSPV